MEEQIAQEAVLTAERDEALAKLEATASERNRAM